MRRIAVLMTCHNRVEKTTACLYKVFQLQLPGDVGLDVHLVDDGCTDGTYAAVRSLFPQVYLYSGNGSLYWAGGMRKAWSEASVHNYDFYLWLNDDTLLYEDAMFKMLRVMDESDSPVIACGSTVDPRDTSKWTYGGYDANWTLIVPQNATVNCVFFNGNCVLIPNEVYAKLGNIDRAYSHSLGDFDYGIRAKMAGISMLVVPGRVGECEEHDRLPRWCRAEASAFQRLKWLYEPLGCNPFEFFVFDRRQNGFFMAIIHFYSLHLRAVFPGIWGKK